MAATTAKDTGEAAMRCLLQTGDGRTIDDPNAGPRPFAEAAEAARFQAAQARVQRLELLIAELLRVLEGPRFPFSVQVIMAQRIRLALGLPVPRP
jgi:hypothetical protein